MPVAARSTAFVHLSDHAKLDRLRDTCPRRHAAIVALMDVAWATEQRQGRRTRQARATLRDPAAKRHTG